MRKGLEYATRERLIEEIAHLSGIIADLTAPVEIPEPALIPGQALGAVGMRIIHALDKAEGRYVSRTTLMAAVYHDRLGDWPEDSVIAVHIHHLRRKLDPAKAQIVSLYSGGYALRRTAC